MEKYLPFYLPFEILQALYRSECHFGYGYIVWRNCGETLLNNYKRFKTGQKEL